MPAALVENELSCCSSTISPACMPLKQHLIQKLMAIPEVRKANCLFSTFKPKHQLVL